ncbi:MAG: bifunctional 5,10-methylenetetrahydrofolate dehydrogenase/5,10-methenyltetrahydrofolate cyclohydrolase [Candidatus Gracilibacteria bacterium]
MATIMDGRRVSDSLLKEIKADVEGLKARGILPKLVVVLVGEDPASKVYVQKKEEACHLVGILSEIIRLPDTITQDELLKKVIELNNDKSVNGFIIQVPLPAQIDTPKIMKAIDPYKDVDGFHAYNIGKMVISKEFEDLAPCTPMGIIKILEYYKVDVTGMDVTVIGRSNSVGKPIANMLMNRDATVSVCHSRTKNLSKFTSEADLVIVAVGRPKFLTADMVKEGVIVVDVGINRTLDGKLVGDTDFDEISKKASMITPVPGGVGPMTVACLLLNTIKATRKQLSL